MIRRSVLCCGLTVVFVVLAYRPVDESALLPKTKRIAVRPLEGAPEECAEVRVVVPWGYDVPSRAKKPKR